METPRPGPHTPQPAGSSFPGSPGEERVSYITQNRTLALGCSCPVFLTFRSFVQGESHFGVRWTEPQFPPL